ncbi:hypothetical protein [Streptococcus sp. DD12]|uniref:hypothetical protein n=1 Tax=Streptococcus sp. DD12 TaxID=1777880 RepID=UPI00083605F1|nr:hypothetical protein [Streptococcus sp. DD12]
MTLKQRIRTLQAKGEAFTKDSDKLFQGTYTLAFVLAMVMSFISPRYLPWEFKNPLWWTSIGLSGFVFVWSGYRHQWPRLHKIALGVTLLSLLLLWREPSASMATFFLLSVAVDRTDRQLIRRFFTAKLVIACLVFFFYLKGYLPDGQTPQVGEMDKFRYSYGFGPPNSLAMFMLSLAIDYILMAKKGRSLLEILVLALWACLIYAVTDSQIVFYSFVVITLAYLFKPFLSQYFVRGSVILSIVAVIFICGVTFSYWFQPQHPLLVFVNRIVTGRLANAHQYLEVTPIGLFPQNVPWLSYPDGVLITNENFYVDALLRNGLIAYLLFPLMIAAEVIRKRFSYFHMIFILLAFGIAMIESYGVDITMMSILLFPYFAQPLASEPNQTPAEERLSQPYSRVQRRFKART